MLLSSQHGQPRHTWIWLFTVLYSMHSDGFLSDLMFSSGQGERVTLLDLVRIHTNFGTDTDRHLAAKAHWSGRSGKPWRRHNQSSSHSHPCEKRLKKRL